MKSWNNKLKLHRLKVLKKLYFCVKLKNVLQIITNTIRFEQRKNHYIEKRFDICFLLIAILKFQKSLVITNILDIGWETFER